MNEFQFAVAQRNVLCLVSVSGKQPMGEDTRYQLCRCLIPQEGSDPALASRHVRFVIADAR